jgi:hypothetical protein
MKEDFDLEAFNVRISEMVEAYQIREARDLIASIPGACETTWGKLLAPPVVTTQPDTGRGDFIANTDWIGAHRFELDGQWVAMWNGRMLAKAPSFGELQEYLEESGLLAKQPLVVKVLR